LNFRKENPSNRSGAPDLTSLIDVVFQLLIFFLLTSKYVEQAPSPSSSIPVNLPESALTASSNLPQEMVISVDEDEKIYVGDEEMTLDQLTQHLSQIVQKKPNTLVLIRGDQKVSYGQIGQIMSIVQASGLKMSVILQSGP
jgi:biopolymer transport protein TolR